METLSCSLLHFWCWCQEDGVAGAITYAFTYAFIHYYRVKSVRLSLHACLCSHGFKTRAEITGHLLYAACRMKSSSVPSPFPACAPSAPNKCYKVTKGNNWWCFRIWSQLYVSSAFPSPLLLIQQSRLCCFSIYPVGTYGGIRQRFDMDLVPSFWVFCGYLSRL